MSETMLLKHYLKRLRLPVFVKEYEQAARQCDDRGQGFAEYLFMLAEREIHQREGRAMERRIKEAGFPAVKELSDFDFSSAPGLDKQSLLALARGGYIREKANICFVGQSGLGKTHLAIALGREACRQGFRVRYFTVADLALRYLEARDHHDLTKLQRKLGKYDLIVLDELGYVALGQDAPEQLFDFISRCYEQTSIIVTTNLPFGAWTKVFVDERLTGALLDRFTHRIKIFPLEGESYRFRESQRRLEGDRGEPSEGA